MSRYAIEYSRQRGPQGANGNDGAGITAIPNNTLLGNTSGGAAIPVARTAVQMGLQPYSANLDRLDGTASQQRVAIDAIGQKTFVEFLTDASEDTVVISSGTYTVPNSTTVDAELRGVSRQWVGGLFVRDDTATVNGGTVIANNAGAKYVRQWDGVNVVPEFFRVGSNDLRNDTDAINAAALQLPNGGTVRLQNEKTYFGKKVVINPGTRLEGGTIKRIELPQTTLAAQANVGATSITVASASAFRVGMEIQIATGLGYLDTASRDSTGFIVSAISGNVITLHRATLFTMASGANVFEYCLQLACSEEDAVVANDADFIVYNVTFDGNNTQNDLTHSWTLNNCAIVSGYLQNVVFEKCRFLDMPSECITVSGRAWIKDCIFKDVYGSCVHGSSPTTNEAKGVVIENCQMDNVCISTAAENGHGPLLGAYTQSNLTVDIQILNCRMEDLNNGYVVSHLSEGLLIQGCYVKNARGIFSEIYQTNPRVAPRVIGCAFIDAGNLACGGVGGEHLLDGLVITGNSFTNSALRAVSNRNAVISDNSFIFNSSYQTRLNAGEIDEIIEEVTAITIGGEFTFSNNRITNTDTAAVSLEHGLHLKGYNTPATSYNVNANTIVDFKTAIYCENNESGTAAPWKDELAIIGNRISIPAVSGARYGIQNFAAGAVISGNVIHSSSSSDAVGIYVYGSDNDTTSGAIGSTVHGNIILGCEYWCQTGWYANVIDGNVYNGSISHISSTTRQAVGINTLLGTSGVDRIALPTSTGSMEFLAFIQMQEVTEPAAPASNSGRLFLKDNGSGKTQMCIRFASGATQVIATEP